MRRGRLQSQSAPEVEKDRFELREDGVLCIRALAYPSQPAKIVVPDCLKAFILRRHHGIPMSGHSGVKKVLRKLKERFWWKHMARDTKRWIGACLICRRRKTPRPMHTGAPGSICAPHRFHTIAIDLVGPTSQTLEGNQYILTMLDTFTRWVVAVPIPSKEASVIAHAIYRHWICKYGSPERIYSDRGTEFVNKGLKSMCRRWSIRKIETTGWQPQSNPVERVHRWLNSCQQHDRATQAVRQ